MVVCLLCVPALPHADMERLKQGEQQQTRNMMP